MAGYRVTSLITTSSFDAFAIGGLLAFYFEFHRERLEVAIKRNLPVILLGVVTLIAVYARAKLGQAGSYQVVWFRMLVSLFAVVLIGRAVFGFDGLLKVFLEHPAIVYLGKISYGLYVYHNFIPWIFEPLVGTEMSMQLWMGPVYFVVTVAVSAASWELMEKPINALKDRS